MTELHSTQDPLERHPVLELRLDDAGINERLFRYVQEPPGKAWWVMFGLSLALTGLLGVAAFVTFGWGVGTWGVQVPVGWAFAITEFVWWIGIGHAGTLISAILLLFMQRWRTSINRFAETMTLFAVMCAGMFPVFHLGRPWFAYWLFPYPSEMRVWPQFRSPLVWDTFAVSTYFTVSLLFWFLGLVPDFASLRDTARRRWQRIAYGIVALGWRGSARHWRHYKSAYLIIAGLATPLVLSVHTIVSMDFAVALLPGWHSTIFPPYFVAGAVFSGFALVATLIIPARHFLGLEGVITGRHLDNMAKIMLVTGWIVTYAYCCENFLAFYSGDPYEIHVAVDRATGHYAVAFWLQIFCNCLVPQAFWSTRVRHTPALLWICSIFINIGMWLERYTIIVASLYKDFLPSAWRPFSPTWVDVSLFVGTIGFFCTAFLLALKLLPIVPVSEVKELGLELDTNPPSGSVPAPAALEG
ncbi:MAG: NrfD/PsrC family molybdoenzyme membrane anchor subunit [Deltaproteobacteria bacterium]